MVPHEPLRTAARLTVVLSIIPLAHCRNGAPDWCAPVDGAVVRLAGKPAGWAHAPQLTPRWRLDGSAEGHELMLPASAAISPEANRIALVDFGLGEVVVLDLAGGWIGRWGHRGDGPRELRAPVAAAWRAGPQLLVYDPANSKLVVFDTTGAAVADEPVNKRFTAALGGGLYWLSLNAVGDLLALLPGRRGIGTGEDLAVIHGQARGSTVDTVVQVSVPVITPRHMTPITAPGWALPDAALSADSVFAIAGETPEYRVDLVSAGRVRTRICRMVPPLPMTSRETQPAEMRREIRPAVEAAMGSAPRPDHPASIGRLQFDAVGRLWVQRDRPGLGSPLNYTAGPEGALYDVYAASGQYLGEVKMPEHVRFLGATAELIIGMESDEYDVYSIVAYGMEPDRIKGQ